MIKSNKFLLLFLIIASIFLVACNNNNDDNPDTNNVVKTFLNIGYSDEEVDAIYKYLSNTDINYLLDYNYIDNLTEYIGYEIFDINNLNRYIAYRDKYSELDFYHTILYVNMNLDKDFYSDVNIVSSPNDILVLVNKYNRLPDDYVPSDLVEVNKRCSVKDGIYLREEANNMLYNMCINMLSLGLDFKVISGYRTKEYQENLYNEYAKNDGEEKAIKYSAKPRHSEHETGLTIDVMGNNKNYLKFDETAEYRYILKHASDYGFIIRYENEFVTGYMNEPWHLRYVGINTAKKIKKENITLDEYVYLYK